MPVEKFGDVTGRLPERCLRVGRNDGFMDCAEQACWRRCALARVLDGARHRLIDAVRRVDANAVRRLIEQKVDVNITQPDGATALHWAAHRNDVAIADLLIRAGAKVDAADEGGVTPLGLASLNASPSMVERLLKAAPTPTPGAKSRPFGRTQRQRRRDAAAAGARRRCEREGAGPRSDRLDVGSCRRTCRCRARADRARRRRESQDHSGQDRGLRPRRHRRPRRRHGRRVERCERLHALLFAARAGDLASVRLLADAGADVNDAADGLSALVLATVRAHVDVALFLLEKGADANLAGAGFTALHWASGSWETELTVTSITPDREGEEWRTVAGLRERRIDLVKALLAHGADPNARIGDRRRE